MEINAELVGSVETQMKRKLSLFINTRPVANGE